MSRFRTVTDKISVSPQITPADVAAAADEGFALIVNNRPDGEEPTQPDGAEIAAAAEEAGLAYIYIPVRGMPTPEQVDAVREAVDEAHGKVLLFCRSGTRSIVSWSLGQAASGASSRDDLVALGEAAGYDLSGVLPR
ncbi:TIGR01244 family sulfur transferase [Caulobacter segnis]|uniref:TIGR01244 family sulfur transferase n=1 Tax=Caulobacter segnis TaxID=88688 RepID=UPI002410A386|nr:TIGR01244 family sulfur transferase [Caulobacter segnis]MDG2523374.1 TIGR01244 family sulfur transferase [Caulobacter segnis]